MFTLALSLGLWRDLQERFSPMPSFPAGVTVVETVQNPSMTYVWIDGSTKTKYLSDVPDTATIDDFAGLFTSSAGLSNAALIKYQGAGVKREIALANVALYDEAHGFGDELILTFQKEDTLDIKQWAIPAPDAALFNGVTLKSPTDAVQGTRILATIDNFGDIYNQGLSAGEEWLFVSGYLSTAKSKEKRRVPPTATITEPPAGTPSDDPAETPAP